MRFVQSDEVRILGHGTVTDRKKHRENFPIPNYPSDQSSVVFFQYIRVSHDTDANHLIELMLKRWDLEVPNLVISVTGGAKSFVLKPRLKEVFRRGLVKAAKTTGAWIMTGKLTCLQDRHFTLFSDALYM